MKLFFVRKMEKCNDYLNSNGVRFMFPGLDSKVFYLIKLFLVVIASVVTSMIFPYLLLVSIAVSYKLPDVLIRISNSADNDAMLKDIESIYDILRIQARAGVFIQDSLLECYISTRNKRLKAALLELCNQISINSTMEEAVSEFEAKFNNNQISILCIVLRQAQSSGKTVQILSDMSGQIRQLRHSMALKEEGRLERKIEVLELLIFLGVLAIGIYSMGTEIMKMMSF